MWKEGLFMMPQHLQLMDEYHEQLLDRRMSALGTHFWGLAQVEINEDELARGILKLDRCVAVLPDGLLLDVGQNKLTRHLSATVPAVSPGKPLDVYLAVPHAAAGGAAAEDASRGVRFRQLSENVSDIFRMAQDEEIEMVEPNAQLLFGDDNRQNYVTIKIAELLAGDEGRLRVSKTYIAPCLQVQASPVLMNQLGRLVSAMAAKQKDLAAKYGGRQAAMVEFGAADMATFWYLHSINGALPRFMHHASGAVHPEVLYLALCELVGHLSTFEASADPLELPHFDFRDLASSLLPLFERAFQLLGTVVSARFTPIPLEQQQPGLFVATVDDPLLLRRGSLYLLAGGDVADDVLRDDVPRYVKIGSSDQIAQIVHSALPGVQARVDLAPPSGIPVRAHMVYMRLEKQGRYWDALLQSNTIAIYQPVKPDQVKLELLSLEG
jgi:type VI secretion system protein ImpJ